MGQLTTRKAAQILGVSEASVKRWCDRGQIGVSKTPGGHRRLSEHALIEFARRNKYTLAHPELLTVEVDNRHKGLSLEDGKPVMLKALLDQDKSLLHSMMADWCYDGHPLYAIFDATASPVFHEIGSMWERGEVDVAEERAACTLFQQVVLELAAKLKPKRQKDLLAVGGALTGDWYSLPVTMVDMVLREQGWRSLCLGGHLPAESMVSVVERHQPDLFWVSVSHVVDEDAFLRDQRLVAEACDRHNSFLVMGGQALTTELRKKMTYSVYCDTLTHMVSLMKRIFEAPES